MANSTPVPSPPAGRTFAVAMGVLGALALGLVGAAGLAVVRGLDLPSEFPSHDLTQNAPPQAPVTAAADGSPATPAEAPLTPLSYRPIPTPVAPLSAPSPAADEYRPGWIGDPEVLELVEIGATLRREGDMAGALQKIRQADTLFPRHPRILWELASVYKALSLAEKARDTFTLLLDLGPDSGGEYYELATHSLGGLDAGSKPPVTAVRPPFSFGQTLVSTQPDAVDGGRATVRLALQSTLGVRVAPNDIGLVMQFYDLVNGQAIEETRSDPPTQTWPTAPVDWVDAGIEIVEWGYHMPLLTPDEIAAVGNRSYYGYVARLYYRDELQDIIAEPRRLLAMPAAGPDLGPAPMLDNSLFPD